MNHNIRTSAIPVTCQSDRTDIHPLVSLEQGNPNREVRSVHYVQTDFGASLGVMAYCSACCPFCSAPAKKSGPDSKDGDGI